MTDISRGARGRKHPRNPGQLDLVEQIVPALDPYTKSLLHFNGVNGSTTFTDDKGLTWVAGGNAKLDTGDAKFGSASFLSDGNGDYIYGDASANFAFGTGDFTIEFFVKLASLPGATKIFYDGQAPGYTGPYTTLFINASNKLVYNANGSDRIISTTSLTTGSWLHIMLARAGTSTKMFLNGTQEGSTYTDSTDYLIAPNRPLLMNGYDAAYSVDGRMDEFRISKGIARQTSNFTPPTQEYSIYV